jgi:cytochrome c biogenesis protein CcmG/thiol:disulfide interchange protein DsbE
VVAITVAAMLYTGAYQSRRTRGANNAVQGNAVGKPAPDFELETLDGKKVKLSDYRGKAVLLNFWATWCQPCKIEMPWLIEFQDKYRDQGFAIVGVAMEDTEKPEIEKFLKEMGVNYVVLLGKESVGESYGGVLGLPTTFYIGRDGTIVEQHAGLKGKPEIEALIQKAIATGPGKP